MSTTAKAAHGSVVLSEMKEFASFSKSTQRYIRRSLDVGLCRRDANKRWSRDLVESASIRAQELIYRRIEHIRGYLPDDNDIEQSEVMMAPLIVMTAFDLGQGRILSFAAYRFLYERLIGAGARPWLPSAFVAAAAMPHLHPDARRDLLQSITERSATAPGWSNREPTFYPEWVEKVDLQQAA